MIRSNLKSAVIALTLLLNYSSLAQNDPRPVKENGFYISAETDPAFWVGTIPNGAGFDMNIDLRTKKYSRMRTGILIYSGKWSGGFAKDLLLTSDFTEGDLVTQWSGCGLETQYQFRWGMTRGGLQPGIRLQWNRFIYHQNNVAIGTANHFVVTPQVGFQWFPFKKAGFYVLPWAGAQIPVLGTDKLIINETARATRKLMAVVTVHIGWEFEF